MPGTVRHFANPTYWECFRKLPGDIQDLAKSSLELLKADPEHPSLHFKKVGKYWSVRVGRRYRALAVESVEGLIWFWIGSHADYDHQIK